MYWFMENKFKIAYEKAREVLDHMNYYGGIVDLDELIKVIEKRFNVDITLATEKFSEVESTKKFSAFGAAMSVSRLKDVPKGESNKMAVIMLNSDWPIKKMRFSLAHELGHLATEKHNITDNSKRFSVSTNINPDIMTIDPKNLTSDYLINEQIANIFALLVLMPSPTFETTVALFNNNDAVADYFGVDKEAVNSRLILERSANEQ